MDIKNDSYDTASTWLYSLVPSFKRFSFNSTVWLKLVIGSTIIFLLINWFNQSEQVEKDSLRYINSPKINDIYFLDFRLFSSSLRPKEKYRLAKVVDITGEVVTLQYGNMFYLRQNSIKDSIRYGQLRYRKYFEPKRYDFTLERIKRLWQSGAIYLVKRPILDKLFGNYVSPDKISENPSFLFLVYVKIHRLVLY